MTLTDRIHEREFRGRKTHPALNMWLRIWGIDTRKEGYWHG